MNRILIVEDDKLLNDGLAYSLKDSGYHVLSAYDGERAKQMLGHSPDLILLDINLPDMDGFKLCDSIRRHTNIPIIFLTAKDAEEDIIQGFKTGGDDYITKPFSLPVLKERIKAVLKRRTADTNIYFFRNLTFDTDKLRLMKGEREIALTSTETKLVKMFIANSGKVLTRQQIIDKVWDIDGNFVDENTLNVNIKRLRNKIEDNPSAPVVIKTVFGIGYKWGDTV